MKLKWRYFLLVIPFLLLASSFTVLSGEAPSNYFSQDLKKGKVLSWEYYVHDFTPLSENILELWDITVVQDIPDTQINYDLLYEYFNISINGEEYKDYIDYKYSLPNFIYPIAYTVGNASQPMYEYLGDFFLTYTGTSLNYTIGREKGYVEIEGHKIEPYFYQVFELRIHEKTGIVEHSFNHNIFDDGDQNYTINVTYTGGMKLVSNEFTMVPIVLIGIPIIGVILRRRRD